MAGDWSDEQNDAIVADYFAMLANDIAGRPYSKAEHMGAAEPAIRSGAFGFNSVLVAIALGGVFFVLDRVSIVYALLATIATAVVFAAVSAALEPVGVPALTLPFVLVTWLFLLASPDLSQAPACGDRKLNELPTMRRPSAEDADLMLPLTGKNWSSIFDHVGSDVIVALDDQGSVHVLLALLKI